MKRLETSASLKSQNNWIMKYKDRRIGLAFLFIFFNFFSNAQNHIEIIIKNVDSNRSTIQLTVSEEDNYPYPDLKRTKLLLPHNASKRMRVSNSNIQIGTSRTITVWDGDTLKVHLKRSSKNVELISDNDSLLFYPTFLQEQFYKKTKTPLRWLRDQDPSYADFATYTENYYQKKRLFIHSFFKDKKIELQHLLQINNDYERLESYLNSNFYDSARHGGLISDSLITAISQKTPHPLVQNGLNYYRVSLYELASFLTRKKFPNALSSDDFNQNFVEVAENEFSKPITDFLLMQKLFYINFNAKNVNQNSAEMVWKKLQISSLDKVYISKASKLYEEYKKSLKRLNDLLAAKVKNANGKIITLRDVISINKPLFIDFWATWCLPCIAEFPYLQSVEKKFPTVNFISLSIDEDEQRWFKFIKEEKVDTKRSFLLVDPPKNLLTDIYSLTNVPRFILFNSKGKCLSANYIRPSDPAFEKDFRKKLVL